MNTVLIIYNELAKNPCFYSCMAEDEVFDEMHLKFILSGEFDDNDEFKKAVSEALEMAKESLF